MPVLQEEARPVRAEGRHGAAQRRQRADEPSGGGGGRPGVVEPDGRGRPVACSRARSGIPGVEEGHAPVRRAGEELPAVGAGVREGRDLGFPALPEPPDGQERSLLTFRHMLPKSRSSRKMLK